MSYKLCNILVKFHCKLSHTSLKYIIMISLDVKIRTAVKYVDKLQQISNTILFIAYIIINNKAILLIAVYN